MGYGFAEVLGNSVRVKVVETLLDRLELSVSEIAVKSAISKQAAYKELKSLLAQGIINAGKQRKMTFILNKKSKIAKALLKVRKVMAK